MVQGLGALPGVEMACVSSECARYSRLERVDGRVLLHIEFDMGDATATLRVMLTPPFELDWAALRR